jgi:lysophospholipase L1-like esterase
MIQDAKARQTVPVLGTLTPMTGTHDLWASGVTALNPRIRALAAEEGARLADLEKAFGGSPEQYLQGDGLHPNAAGNEIIARVFGSRAD